MEWPTTEVMNFQRPAHNVMVLSGEGGIGKSTLIRHLAGLAQNRDLDGMPEDCAVAVIDFADLSSQSFETVMLRVRAALGRLGKPWPAFDIALSAYWERKHPGESLVRFLDRSSSIGAVADSLRLSEQVASSVDGLFAGLGAVSVAYRVLDVVGTSARQSVTLKRLRRGLPAFDPILREADPDKMLGYLPILLGADLERIRQRRPVLALCVLDTFENVQSLPSERGGLEDLVARMAYLMPNVFFLVGSRRPLQWHDPVRSVGLTYGGARRWPGMADTDDQPDQFPVDGLESQDADRFLRERLTVDDAPAIGRPLRERIVAGSGGSPLYLELSAGLFERYMVRGETPAPEVFGEPFPELVLRMMRDLSPEDRDLLRAAALLEAFDDRLLAAILPEARGRRIEDFLTRRFVRYDPTVWPPCRLHGNFRRGVTACDAHTLDGWTVRERQARVSQAIEYLTGFTLSIWSDDSPADLSPADHSRRTVAAFLLALYGAAEHGVLPPSLGQMAYTLRYLGHWQVLASLPELTEGTSPVLAELTAVARLSAQAGQEATQRYAAMRAAVEDIDASPYADYFHFALGDLAQFTGALPDSDRHFTVVAEARTPIGVAARFDLAGNAFRRSRYTDVVKRIEGWSAATRLQSIGAQDLLGHVHLHNARFPEAAELFTEVLAQARQADAPLWAARAARHLALASMWFAPDRTLQIVPEARELNQSLGEVVGLAQCDMAASMAHAMRGEWDSAEYLLGAARRTFETVGATAELLPIDVVEVIQLIARGRDEQARDLTRRLAEAASVEEPFLPAWAAVTALWTEQPELYDFTGIGWLDLPGTTQERWLRPLRRLRPGDEA
ncbi:hypothetical protein Ssi03_45730 [Sphaerisporangium siamense]|uniref:Energy-coupling factor transporter ATP-binding protein EcfA2 n=1 Tax=Sphaerisporangium siamense TaxID=795645 RepID=A0A7W7GDR8_9ACTN|nr:hypothetical protein [Sphaerisporangium siamense]MBB4705265.1 energy-coupling factor transporter ATP-binding protein EcfA2 [Sphaerisporangium siamense]GII86583.1 hypothetical protein Ssi03_45730 [Sphaerisporangium siamense]